MLKDLFDDTLFILYFIKTNKIYNSKRITYNNTYFFGITNGSIQASKLYNEKVLIIHFKIDEITERLLPKKYNSHELTRGYKTYSANYKNSSYGNILYQHKLFHVFSKSYKKSNKKMIHNRSINLDAFIIKDKLPIELIHHISSYLEVIQSFYLNNLNELYFSLSNLRIAQ